MKNQSSVFFYCIDLKTIMNTSNTELRDFLSHHTMGTIPMQLYDVTMRYVHFILCLTISCYTLLQVTLMIDEAGQLCCLG